MKIKVYCSRLGEDKQQALKMIARKFKEEITDGPTYKEGYYVFEIK